MKKSARFLSLLLLCAMLMSFMSFPAAAEDIDVAERPIEPENAEVAEPMATAPWSGSGTDASPYLIQSKEDLIALATTLAGSSYGTYRGSTYSLTADIDLGGMEWTPIGTTADQCIQGVFMGNGHTISNFTISSSSQYVGLFGVIGGEVCQLNISDATVTGTYNSFDGGVGAAVGVLSKNARICNVHVLDSTVTGKSNTGGVVGMVVQAGTICSCSFEGSDSTVTYNGTNGCSVGGILGSAYTTGIDFGMTTVSGCWCTAKMIDASSGTGTRDAGGIVGGQATSPKNNGRYWYPTSLTVTNCYNSAEVKNTGKFATGTCGRAGGIVGIIDNSDRTDVTCEVSCCYNIGKISGGEGGNYTVDYIAGAGGIAGACFAYSRGNQFSITNCYNAGTVQAIAATSGTSKVYKYSCEIACPIKYVSSTYTNMKISDCGYLKDSCIKTRDIGSSWIAQGTSYDASGLIAVMKTDLTASCWDWDNTIGAGYPTLKMCDGENCNCGCHCAAETGSGEGGGETGGEEESTGDWDTWDGSTEAFDTSGNKGSSADNPILIENAEQLAYLAYVYQNQKTTGYPKEEYYKLMCNLDLDGFNKDGTGKANRAWNPIGYKKVNSITVADANAFKGHFDGNGKTIRNIQLSKINQYAGLFVWTYGGSIHDLTVKNAKSSGGSGVNGGDSIGALAGKINGSNIYNITIEDCDLSSDGSNGNEPAVGGLCGTLIGGTVSQVCVNNSTISVSNPNHAYAGGVAGINKTTATVMSQVYVRNSNVSSSSASTNNTTSVDAGGVLASAAIAGSLICNAHVIDTNVTATCTGKELKMRAGGVLGSTEQTITICSSSYEGDEITPKVSCSGPTSTDVMVDGMCVSGGIVGWVGGSTTLNLSTSYCSDAKIEAYHTAGGMIGLVGPKDGSYSTTPPSVIAKVSNCYNTSSVTTTKFDSSKKYSSAAGIVGRIYSNSNGSCLIEKCVNTGTIKSAAAVTHSSGVTLISYAGGIVGRNGTTKDYEIPVRSCFNSALVKTDSTVYNGYNAPICPLSTAATLSGNFYNNAAANQPSSGTYDSAYRTNKMVNQGTSVTTDSALIVKMDGVLSTDQWIFDGTNFPTLKLCSGKNCTCGCHCVPSGDEPDTPVAPAAPDNVTGIADAVKINGGESTSPIKGTAGVDYKLPEDGVVLGDDGKYTYTVTLLKPDEYAGAYQSAALVEGKTTVTFVYTDDGWKVQTPAEVTVQHVHAKGEPHDAVAAKCETTGTKEYWDCADLTCNAKLDSNGSVITELTVDALGHDFTGEYVHNTEPDVHQHAKKCVHEGCTAVGMVIDGVQTKGYVNCTYGNWTETTAPTCTTAGVETGTCVCGDTKTREVNALGHTDEDEDHICDRCHIILAYVVHYMNGAANEFASETVAPNASVVFPASDPTKTDFTFKGWATAEAPDEPVESYTPTGNSVDHYLYAVWEKDAPADVTVIDGAVKINGGETKSPIKGTAGVDYALPEDGVVLGEDGKYTYTVTLLKPDEYGDATHDESFVEGKNVVVFVYGENGWEVQTPAEVTVTVKTFTVTFIQPTTLSNSGVLPLPTGEGYTAGENCVTLTVPMSANGKAQITLPDCSDTDAKGNIWAYVFRGWYEVGGGAAAGTWIDENEAFTVTGDVTFIGVWRLASLTGDKSWNFRDAMSIMDHIDNSKAFEFCEEQLAIANFDLDKRGTINYRDSMAIMSWAEKTLTVFPFPDDNP